MEIEGILNPRAFYLNDRGSVLLGKEWELLYHFKDIKEKDLKELVQVEQDENGIWKESGLSKQIK